MKDLISKLKEETVQKLNLNCEDENDSMHNLMGVVNETVYNKMLQVEILVYDYTKYVEETDYFERAFEEYLQEYGICDEDIETLKDYILEDSEIVNMEIAGRISDVVENILSDYLETKSDEELEDEDALLEGMNKFLFKRFYGDSEDLYEELIHFYFEDKIGEMIEWEKENR